MSESETENSAGVLLGRPFLQTAKTIIDVCDGRICLDYHGEKYNFSIDEAMRKPINVENVNVIDVIEPLVQEFLEAEFLQGREDETEVSEEVEKEIAGWCEAVQTLGLTDQEIGDAIMEFCRSPDFPKSSGSVRTSNGSTGSAQ